MANKAIEDAVDDLIRKGRIADSLRAEYIAHFEKNLNNDLLRGADYTRKTQQLAEERRAAEAKIREEYTKLQSERQELQKWQGQVQQDLDEYGRVIRQMPELTAKVAAYEQLMKDYSVPMDQVVIPSTVHNQDPPARKVPTMTQTTPETPKDGLTRDEAAAYIRDLTILNGKANRINAQHMKLYGEPLEDDLVTHFLTTGQDMEEHWRIKYGVDAKKAELASRQREAEIAKIREEERQKILSEITSDPSRVMGATPFQRNGGLAPNLEQYMGSRATAHAKEAIGDKGERLPPEQIPQLAAQNERIRAASEMYLKNFDASGTPITDEGKRLYQKHFVTDQY